MKCEPCPTGCSQCNLYLTNHLPNTSPLPACVGDGLCSYALKCYACTSSSYILAEGFCISRNRCRRYSWYNSTASGFNLAYCYCKDNFYSTGSGTCARCHYTCLTCSGTSSSSCLTCPYGQTAISGACSIPAGIGSASVTYNSTF